jgi:hypothetical protein
MPRRKKQKDRITQCERCSRICREGTVQECARLEFEALARGEHYECPEYERNYWDQMAA